MSSLKSYMEEFRISAGLVSEVKDAGTEGQMVALQAALKQYFMKNRTWDFHWGESVKNKRHAPDDETDYDEPVEVVVKDIVVQVLDGYPVIKFTFTSDEKLSDLEASNDFMAATKRIVKNLYPKAQVSTDDSGKNYLNVVI
jgi:hypothetical protein